MATLAEETQPLLQTEACPKTYNDAVAKDVVDFDPNGDAENPLDWPNSYKWSIVALLAIMAFTITFTCISLVPVANHIVSDLDGKPNKSASVLLVTIWELGEAAGPLFIAPLSELYGRYPVFNVANTLFIAATVMASLAPTSHVLIAARFLTGLAVASNVLSPAVVGDMFISEQRGTAMSIIMLAPLMGGAIGPAISGYIAESLGWRPVLWISAGLALILELLFLTCFRETFKVPILARRAATLRAETGNRSLKTVYETQEAEKGRNIWKSMLRPFVVLAGSGVLQALSLFGSVVFAYFYIFSTSLPDILQGIYGLSPAQTGFAFISFSVGSIITVTICNQFLDKIYISLRDTHKGKGQPEYRLPLVIIGGFFLPFAAAMYGWVAQVRLGIVMSLLATALIGVGIMLAFLPLMAYVVDAFGLYSASAMTAVIVTRCLMGTFLPLATEPLVRLFGYGWAFTTLGAITLCLAPIPVLVMRYGTRWRQNSKYSRGE